MNDILIQEFHDACVSQDSHFDKLQFKHKFRKELLHNAYEKSEIYDEKIHVNGLFWSLLFGNFEMSYYMIENEYFDPTKLFCGEIHILHLLATMGGRNNNVRCPQEPIVELFLNYDVVSENNKFVPTPIKEGFSISPIIYKKKEIIKFAEKLVKNYDINVSVKTRWKWWLNERDATILNNFTTQASTWYKFYRSCIFYLKENLSMVYECIEYTPFHLACLFGSKEFVEFLVIQGCDIFCVNCKTICEKCPYHIISFYEAKNEWHLDDLLDNYFSIYYYSNRAEPDLESIQIYKINDYFYDDIVYMIMNEERFLKKNTLQMKIIEKLSKSIVNGKYIKNIHLLQKSLKRDIKLYIEINYHKAKKIIYSSVRKR